MAFAILCLYAAQMTAFAWVVCALSVQWPWVVLYTAVPLQCGETASCAYRSWCWSVDKMTALLHYECQGLHKYFITWYWASKNLSELEIIKVLYASKGLMCASWADWKECEKYLEWHLNFKRSYRIMWWIFRACLQSLKLRPWIKIISYLFTVYLFFPPQYFWVLWQ